MPNSVYIIGHKNPDTDSICAAIAYSYLKNALSTGDNYIPKKAGPLNKETRYVLERFNVPEPETISDVGAQLMDIEYRQLEGVDGHIS
ncbi:MAG: DHH family phosphoesterase, partial [Pseudobutyrivibrio sp.]|nr:DHH family phosphoesterase [Pseudobutyrivibrio sp.]